MFVGGGGKGQGCLALLLFFLVLFVWDFLVVNLVIITFPDICNGQCLRLHIYK